MRSGLQEELEQEIYAILGERAYLVSEEELREQIDLVIQNCRIREHLQLEERLKLKEDLIYSFRGYGLLSRLLDEEAVTEIMVNGDGTVFYEKEGRLHRYEKQMQSPAKTGDIIQKMIAFSGRKVNESNPIADARLPDGSRLNIVLPPVSIDGPVITIRRFSNEPYTIERLINNQTMTEEVAALLGNMVRQKKNLFIFGGTGSGKTTLLNAVAEFIDPNERIITIEDSAELQIRHIANLVRLEVRQAEADYLSDITIRDLIRCSLRMRPDRIIVGEVRGAEAFDMLNAMNTGHEGSISTGHANSAEDMLLRLEMMVLGAMQISEPVLQRLIVSALDYLVEIRRQSDGSRKIVGIYAVKGIQADRSYNLQTVYAYGG